MNWYFVFPAGALVCCLLMATTDPPARWCRRLVAGYFVAMTGCIVTLVLRTFARLVLPQPFPGEPMTETFETVLDALATLFENPTARLVTTCVGLLWASVCVARGAWWVGKKTVGSVARLFEAKPPGPCDPFVAAILARLEMPGWVPAQTTDRGFILKQVTSGYPEARVLNGGVMYIEGVDGDVLTEPFKGDKVRLKQAIDTAKKMWQDAKDADLLAKVTPKLVDPPVTAKVENLVTKPAGVPVGTVTIPNVTKEQVEKIIEELRKNAYYGISGLGYTGIPYWPGVTTTAKEPKA